MIYLLAIIVPPLALLLKGKIFQAIFNGIIWVISIALAIISLGALSLLWFVSVIWAIVAVKNAKDDERHEELVDAMRSRR